MLVSLVFGNLQLDHVTLDQNSTVMMRYGRKESAAREINPRKAFIADARMTANLWLRPGNR